MGLRGHQMSPAKRAPLPLAAPGAPRPTAGGTDPLWSTVRGSGIWRRERHVWSCTYGGTVGAFSALGWGAHSCCGRFQVAKTPSCGGSEDGSPNSSRLASAVV